MNAVVEVKPGALVSAGRMAASEVIAHVGTVQDVLANVMKAEVHFGTIPGTDKPTLLQPGADVLAMAFRIAFEIHEEDLSTDDVVRYRVKVRAVHQTTGVVLGEGVGECSGAEEKYRWRRAVCDEEFDEAPATHKRIKFAKGRGANAPIYKNKQVRTDPADAANTVLKMAVKRAKIAVILNVTGASAVFGQDLEDLPEELREAFTGKAPAPATVSMTDEQRSAWKAESEKGRRAGRAFWLALPENVRAGVTQEERDAMWAIAVTADEARRGAAPADQSGATASAAETAAGDAATKATTQPTAAPAAAPAPPPADDDFVAAMNAAEAAASGEVPAANATAAGAA